MPQPPEIRPFADAVLAYAQAGWPCITLPSGHLALVDADDFARLARYDWRIQQPGHYVRATVNSARTHLHRLIVGATAGQVVDHINHNPLDNRRTNLRICNDAQDLANKRRPRTNTGGYKGVVWRPSRHKWEASVQPRGKARFLGRFDDPWDAAQAYNSAALELYGEFAQLNEEQSGGVE